MKAETIIDSESLKRDLLKAQEINFAKALAGNDKKLRDKAVKKLKKWLAIRSQGKCAFTEEDFYRIWTGLFYCMWMSDKFLIQEEVAESISNLVHCFHNNTEAALLFIKCFNKTMNIEWDGLDQHRIDKFNMMIRRFLRQSLEYCRRKDWDEALVKELIRIFDEVIFSRNGPNGYLLHFIDIFPEELAKVSRGKLKKGLLTILFEPFIKLTAVSRDSRIHRAISQFFEYLMRQTDIGIIFEEKLKAWKAQGFPSKRPEEMTMIMSDGDTNEDSDTDEVMDIGPMDPRAGKVHAILPQIRFDCGEVLSSIEKYQHDECTTRSGRSSLIHLAKKFRKLQEGKMPEDIWRPEILNQNIKKRRHTLGCAKKLMNFTKELYEKESQLVLEEDGETDIGDSSVEETENVITEKTAICDNEKYKKMEKKKKKRKEKKKIVDAENCKNLEESSQTENRVQSTNKEVIKKKKKKKKKKKFLPGVVSVEKKEKQFDTGNSPLQKSPEMNAVNSPLREKPADTKPLVLEKHKSPAGRVDVVNETEQSVVLKTNRKRKRKALSPWHVLDLEVDSEEYNKITVPKIIRLETKVNGKLSVRENDDLDGLAEEKLTTNQVPFIPAFWEKAKAKVNKKKMSMDKLILNPFFDAENQPKNSKRISFALERNVAQGNEEYLEEVKNSPNIPFDGSRKPNQSALKSGLLPSPINPFYRFAKK